MHRRPEHPDDVPAHVRERPLPWPRNDVVEQLNRPLTRSRDNLRLVVERVSYLEGLATATVRLTVTAESDRRRGPERWQVDLPVDPTEVRRLVELDNFALVTRSGLEEWWIMRHTEAHTRAQGTRLS